MPSVEVVAVLWRRTRPCLDGLTTVRRGCPRHREHSQWLLLSMPWDMEKKASIFLRSVAEMCLRGSDISQYDDSGATSGDAS